MPPKLTKEKQKIIEDKTFGLKNKNRSAKVQKFVQTVVQNVKSGSQAEQKKQKELAEKRSAKEARLAFEAEMATLFKAVKEDKPAAAAGGEDDDQEGCNPDDYLWRPEDFDEVEAIEGRLEDRLDEERQALVGRTDLTPVTEETFRAWRERKKQEKAEAEAARIRRARETGHGMRGYDLWQHDQSLFVDDADADDFYEREEMGLIEEGDEGDAPAAAAKPAATARHVDPSAATAVAAEDQSLFDDDDDEDGGDDA